MANNIDSTTRTRADHLCRAIMYPDLLELLDIPMEEERTQQGPKVIVQYLPPHISMGQVLLSMEQRATTGLSPVGAAREEERKQEEEEEERKQAEEEEERKQAEEEERKQAEEEEERIQLAREQERQKNGQLPSALGNGLGLSSVGAGVDSMHPAIYQSKCLMQFVFFCSCFFRYFGPPFCPMCMFFCSPFYPMCMFLRCNIFSLSDLRCPKPRNPLTHHVFKKSTGCIGRVIPKNPLSRCLHARGDGAENRPTRVKSAGKKNSRPT